MPVSVWKSCFTLNFVSTLHTVTSMKYPDRKNGFHTWCGRPSVLTCWMPQQLIRSVVHLSCMFPAGPDTSLDCWCWDLSRNEGGIYHILYMVYLPFFTRSFRFSEDFLVKKGSYAVYNIWYISPFLPKRFEALFCILGGYIIYYIWYISPFLPKIFGFLKTFWWKRGGMLYIIYGISPLFF